MYAGLGAARVFHSRQFNGEARERSSSPVHSVVHRRHAAQRIQLLLGQRSQSMTIVPQFTYLAGRRKYRPRPASAALNVEIVTTFTV